MFNLICNAFKQRLVESANLNHISLFAGLVETTEYDTYDGDGNLYKKQVPTSRDYTQQGQNYFEEIEVLPNSSQSGVLYFEAASDIALLRAISGGRGIYQANLRLVCWLNLEKIDKDDIGEVVPKTQSAVLFALGKKKLDEHPQYFNCLSGNNFKFVAENPFKQYSYNGTETQFLKFPFRHFAIDFTSTFVLNTCEQTIISNPLNCC